MKLLARGLAVVLLANEASYWVWLYFHGGYRLADSLPLQLCDLATFAAAAALWTRRRGLAELTYFWCLAGSLPALVAPGVPGPFPGFLFLQYFISHGANVLAALLLVLGLGIRPRRWSWAWVYGLTAGLAVVDGGIDLATGGNYLFLRQPPPAPDPLCFFGPWPWYLLGGAVLALVFLLALDLPFRLGRRARLEEAGVGVDDEGADEHGVGTAESALADGGVGDQRERARRGAKQSTRAEQGQSRRRVGNEIER